MRLTSLLLSIGLCVCSIAVAEEIASNETGSEPNDVQVNTGGNQRSIAILKSRLEKPGLSEPTRRAAVMALFELGADREDLPYLREQTLEHRGVWLYRYFEAIKQIGQREAATTELLVSEFSRGDLPFETLQKWAWAMREVMPEEAASVLARFAMRDPEKWGSDYGDLLKKVRDGEQRLAAFYRRTGTASEHPTSWRIQAGNLLNKQNDRKGAIAVFDSLLRDGVCTPEEERSLIFSLLELEAYEAVLHHLRNRAAGRSGNWLYTYAETARKAGRTQQLAAFLGTELERVDLSQQARRERIWLLIDRMPQRSLSIFRRLAEKDPLTWIQYYREALSRTTDGDRRLADLYHRKGAERGLPKDWRRHLGYSLLEMGEKEKAIADFRSLAQDDAFDGADTRQLLFLWGPRPDHDALEWLAAQARRASTPDQQAGWLRHLMNKGAAAQAFGVIADHLDRHNPEIRGVAIESLLTSGRRDELERYLSEAVLLDTDRIRLNRYAEVARAQGLTMVAEAAWNSVLTDAADDPQALRGVGVIAYERGLKPKAIQLFRQYLKHKSKDFEVCFLLAEALRSQGDLKAASKLYQHTLDILKAQERTSDYGHVIKGKAQHRLGLVDASLLTFKRLVDDPRVPRNMVIPAYVEVLTANDRHDEALRALEYH